MDIGAIQEADDELDHWRSRLARIGMDDPHILVQTMARFLQSNIVDHAEPNNAAAALEILLRLIDKLVGRVLDNEEDVFDERAETFVSLTEYYHLQKTIG